MKRHEIQVLLKAGLPQDKIAEIAAVSERTVRTVAGEAPLTEEKQGSGTLGFPLLVSIHEVVTDQRLVAWLGNIYVNEIL